MTDTAKILDKVLDSGLTHHRAGRLDDATICYREALALDADNPEAHHFLGIISLQSGKPSEATEWIVAAVQGDPENAKYRGNLGAAYLADGQVSEALEMLEKAAGLDPESIDILCNLAAAQRGTGGLDSAIATYLRAQGQAPGDPAIPAGLAASYLALGQYENALEAADRAIEIESGNGEWHGIRGAILLSMARYDESIVALEAAVELSPDLTDARCNLALAYQNVCRLEEAGCAYGAVIDRWPENAAAHAGLGRTQRLQGDLGAAINSFRRAVDLNPGNPRTNSSLLFNLLGDPNTEDAALFEAHRDWNTRHAASVGPDSPRHDNDPDPDRRIRIGYVSSDFRDHPVGRLILPVIAAHDRSLVDIAAYSQATSPDAITQRIHESVDRFCDIAALDDETLATRIRDDNIDILVDLSGHSARNRLTAFARRPAPVQATWLGYMASTGLETMDYLIGDPVHTPEGDAALYSEQIVRLPHDLLCFVPPDDAPDVVPPPCLSRGAVTFGCFNNPGKVTDPVLALWAQILTAVPDAHLYLRYLGYEDAGVQNNFRDRLGALGIEKTRLRFSGEASYREVLASYGEIDIALDTFPYSGTMTTLEALWMGVPVIASRGSRMVARQAAAHLTAAGLADLVADNPKDYADLAVSLANDRTRLSDLRSGMRDRLRASPLCDVAGFTRSLEALYRTMWHGWCAVGQERR